MKYSGEAFDHEFAVDEPFFPETFIIEKKKHSLMR